jgi:hypothetical protein
MRILHAPDWKTLAGPSQRKVESQCGEVTLGHTLMLFLIRDTLR